MQVLRALVEGGARARRREQRQPPEGGHPLRHLPQGLRHRLLERFLRGLPVPGPAARHQVGDKVPEHALHPARLGDPRHRSSACRAEHPDDDHLLRTAGAHGHQQLHVHHAERAHLHPHRRRPLPGGVRQGAAPAGGPGRRRRHRAPWGFARQSEEVDDRGGRGLRQGAAIARRAAVGQQRRVEALQPGAGCDERHQHEHDDHPQLRGEDGGDDPGPLRHALHADFGDRPRLPLLARDGAHQPGADNNHRRHDEEQPRNLLRRLGQAAPVPAGGHGGHPLHQGLRRGADRPGEDGVRPGVRDQVPGHLLHDPVLHVHHVPAASQALHPGEPQRLRHVAPRQSGADGHHVAHAPADVSPGCHLRGVQPHPESRHGSAVVQKTGDLPEVEGGSALRGVAPGRRGERVPVVLHAHPGGHGSIVEASG
mmetsp:Transcript_75782/g.209127  ORF Transcript_75782/g.209127 Transcript_75782/m.209127 type:complete len:424 (-) Transcript_75782:1151-2422(-)